MDISPLLQIYTTTAVESDGHMHIRVRVRGESWTANPQTHLALILSIYIVYRHIITLFRTIITTIGFSFPFRYFLLTPMLMGAMPPKGVGVTGKRLSKIVGEIFQLLLEHRIIGKFTGL